MLVLAIVRLVPGMWYAQQKYSTLLTFVEQSITQHMIFATASGQALDCDDQV